MTTPLQLGEQLAVWAQAAIDEGRSPFRKAEVFPSLLTEAGNVRPPLVFWINRDSFMAGGVVLLAEDKLEKILVQGRCCARALGLRHFVTWSTERISIWEECGESAKHFKEIALPGGRASADIHSREALGALMEELKLLSVLGAVPASQLSSHYLANLCQGTLLAASEPLAETYRVALGENRPSPEPRDASALARDKALLSLLRLLTLVLFDQLPATVQPEGLERAMSFAIEALPQELSRPLQATEEEYPLTEDATVRFHHLFRRLTQLQLNSNPQRVLSILHLLQKQGDFLQKTPPLPALPQPLKPPLLLVNSSQVDSLVEPIYQLAPAPQLALSALLRHLQGLPPAVAQAPSLFTLSLPKPPRTIIGHLGDPSQPAAQQRKAMATLLRTSWPIRRFPLRAQTPLWAWKTLHLLGLAAEGADIRLTLPNNWLCSDYGAVLFELFCEQFTMTRVLEVEEQILEVHLIKRLLPEAQTFIRGRGGERSIAWHLLARQHPARLALALDLPDDIFALLEDERLWIPTQQSWPNSLEREVFLFSRSSLGRALWRMLSCGQALPPRQRLREEALRVGLPLPMPTILDNLCLFTWNESRPPTAHAIDTELERWLKVTVAMMEPERPIRSDGGPQIERPEVSRAELFVEIAAAAFVDGLPLQDEFFGSITLCDPQGNTLQVEGADSARALILCSYGERLAVSLPTEQNLVASILERYLADLRTLHQELLRHAHKRVPHPREATGIAEKIWNSQPLPPWKLVEDER